MEGHSYDYESVASMAMELDLEKRLQDGEEQEQPRRKWTQRPMPRFYSVQFTMLMIFILIFLLSWYYIRELSMHQPQELMVRASMRKRIYSLLISIRPNEHQIHI